MSVRTDRPKTGAAKAQVLRSIQSGASVKTAIANVGRSEKTYYAWLDNDPDFREQVRVIRAVRAGRGDKVRGRTDLSFAEFAEKYLGITVFPHQQQWIDAIEGRTPKFIHEAIRYEPGDPNYVLINTAPEHSKTMILSISYPVYLLCMDPTVRIVLVSKTQDRAKEYLYAIKQRLTHPRYQKLQIDYAPPDGFKGDSSIWQSQMVYLGETLRDSGEKDPTINAIGLGNQIYGSRATHIICDDTVTLSNASQFESQLRFIQQEAVTRLGPNGKLVIAGTRVDSVDLYSVLREGERYPDGKSPWTYLSQPAVLEFADDPADWVTLWPKSNIPWPGSTDDPDEDGLYPRWDGTRLFKRRRVLDPKTWAMVYQQQAVSSDAIFNPKAVAACQNGNRTVGPLSGNNKHHRRPEGMEGLYVVCSMDPAMAGDTASIAYAVCPKTYKRWVLEAHRMTAPTPQAIRDLIRHWTEKYQPQTWIVEKNAFQLFLTRDEQIRTYLASRGVAMVEHYTGRNKTDPDFGVASLAPLFDEQMIELPSSHNCEGIKALIEQLVTWRPGIKGSELKQDLPLALWFAEIKAREVVDQHTMRAQMHQQSRYVPRYRRGLQKVIHLDEYMRAA